MPTNGVNVYRFAVLLLTITACASAPERYDYSGATPVPPAYTPAGAGAPARGQPGAIDPDRPTLPRGPDKRVLPPEERPGVWASDGDARRAIVLRIKRPQPNRPAGISPEAWAKCWADATYLLMEDVRVMELPEVEMECLRNLLLSDCGGWLIGRADEAKKTGKGEAFLDRYFPLRVWSQNEYDESVVGRRTRRRCDERGAYTRRVADLYRDLGSRGQDHRGWAGR